MARALAHRGAAVTAADLVVPMLVAARANLNASPASANNRDALNHVMNNYVMNSAEALPFATASFDAVTTRLAPHHFTNVSAYVQEVARVLKPNGIFALCDHVGATESATATYLDTIERVRDPSHVEMLSQPAWEALFFQHGLAVTFSELTSMRIPFLKWVNLQQPTAETLARLQVLFKQAPRAVLRWLEPAMPTLGDWYFTRWDIIICGVKS